MPALWYRTASLPHQSLLCMFLFFHACSADAIRTLSLFEDQGIFCLVQTLGPMILLLKDRIRLDGLEFGLEVTNGMAVRAAVGTTASIGELVAIVLGFIARDAPLFGISQGFWPHRAARLTNCSCPHLLSSPSWGQRRCDLTWQNSEVGAGSHRRTRRQGPHDHDRSACGSESLVTKAVSFIRIERDVSMDS